VNNKNLYRGDSILKNRKKVYMAGCLILLMVWGIVSAVQADEITGIQREPGVTASPVEEYWTRREGI